MSMIELKRKDHGVGDVAHQMVPRWWVREFATCSAHASNSQERETKGTVLSIGISICADTVPSLRRSSLSLAMLSTPASALTQSTSTQIFHLPAPRSRPAQAHYMSLMSPNQIMCIPVDKYINCCWYCWVLVASLVSSPISQRGHEGGRLTTLTTPSMSSVTLHCV